MVESLLVGLIILIVLGFVFISSKINQKDSSQLEEKLLELSVSVRSLSESFGKFETNVRDEFQRNRTENSDNFMKNREEQTKTLDSFKEKFDSNVKELNELIRQQFGDFSKQQGELNKLSVDSIKEVNVTIEKQLKEIREDNSKRLEEMRKTVDEKLQTTLEKRLGESFKQVSERLEQVHKGLGEMQTLATGVGDLKKVLSNVKTRGILGEYQLENILEQLLTPEQYSKDVATKKGSQAHVEFAVKLPGKDHEDEVWMPIDSKFPLEGYQTLLDAREAGDLTQIGTAEKVLIKSIETFAKDISTKYLDPPHTTDFGIMFLPIESLYAEVLRHPGLFEKLQRTYRITITGPTTMSALLNSLQMGFRTLAVQKRSSEVWKILEAVKTEFGLFQEHLAKVDRQLGTAKKSIEELRSTRTNQMNRKLKDVGSLELSEAEDILELDNISIIDRDNEQPDED